MDILKIFYECIIPEAMNGRINVYNYYNIAFNTNIVEDNKFYECKVKENDLLIPTLMIKDREMFNELLVQYVNMASDYYDDDNFEEDILNDKAYDEKYMICKEKAIMAFLFANATVEDFNDPISFLKRRIDFINNHQDKHIDLGYSGMLDCNLVLNIEKDIINNEGSSQFEIKAVSEGEEYTFPRVKFGISDDTLYIYAIQKKKRNETNSLSKKINRKLYKVGEGFIETEGEENPKDVTASFLVVLNMAISYFNRMGYDKIVMPSILIERWNAKRFSNIKRQEYGNISDEEKKELDEDQEYIQSNLTNKLIRTFLRLACHYNNLDIVFFPYEVDSSLHVAINNDIEMLCNNRLLLETGKIVNNADNIRNR